jgi:hypothetical protein
MATRSSHVERMKGEKQENMQSWHHNKGMVQPK